MAELAGRLANLALWLMARRGPLFGAAFLAGLLASTGHAPFGLYPLGFLGLLLGYGLFAAAPNAGRAGFVGWALGTGFFMGTLAWIVQPFLVDVARHGWMAPFALFFMGAGLALFWGLASWLAFWLAHGRFLWLAWAAVMTLAELVRGVIFTGFPWGGPAAFWVDTPLIGLAGLIGASGMGFLTFLLVAGAFAALAGPGRMGRMGRMGVLATAVAMAVGLGAFIAGQDLPQRSEPLALRLIQPNAPQHLKWHPDYVRTFLERSIDLTAQPPSPGAGVPDLVIWPETSVPYLLHNAGPVLTRIASAAMPATVVLGIQRREGQQYFNSLVALDAAGDVTSLYDKHHLVPFGEYTPFGGLLHRFGLRGFAAQHGYGYTAGPGAEILDFGRAGKALPLICYEAIFPGILHAAPARADWILQITNDAWFGTFSGPQQHLAIARLRAAEFGLPFVRAANTGISAVINARGQIVASLDLGQAGHLDAMLPGALPKTLYARTGDTILILLLIVIVSGLGWRRRKRKSV